MFLFKTNKISLSPTLFVLFLITTIFNTGNLIAQERKMIEILNSGYGESVEGADVNTQRLVDSVHIKHEEILMWCDTAYMYTGTNKVDAIGNVHIKQGDTLHLYANNVFYDGDMSLARAWNNVRLYNKSTVLYSDTVDYDLENNISYYDDHGKIVDSTTTLTSDIGRYFIDENRIFFYTDVVGYNDDFTLESDTVIYETETGMIFVEGPTTIQDTSNTLYTELGWYDSNTGNSELRKESIVYGETQELRADLIDYDKESSIGHARGNVRIDDIENRSIVLGNFARYNEQVESAIVTDSAVYMSYNETDTLFMHADTLRTVPDTIQGEKIITAYHNVRFFRTDMQGLCDSLVYFTKDSLVQLHQNPVIWSEIHQLTAEQITMKQYTNAPDELHLTDNSFIISKQDTSRFDQIKGRNMIGYVVNNELNLIRVDGNGQTLYYAREEEDQIIGLNRAESSTIDISFKEGKIFKIKFMKSPEGELKPLFEVNDEERKLSGFDWKIEQRPLSRHDIFVKPEEVEENGETEDEAAENSN